MLKQKKAVIVLMQLRPFLWVERLLLITMDVSQPSNSLLSSSGYEPIGIG